MDNSSEYVSVKEANELVDKSTSSLTRFCKKHDGTENIKIEENDRGRPVFFIKKSFLYDNFKRIIKEQSAGQGSKLSELEHHTDISANTFQNKIGSEKAVSTALATQTQECKDLKKQVHKLEKQKKNILVILPVISVIIIIVIIVAALLYKNEAVSVLSDSHQKITAGLTNSHEKELSHIKNSNKKDILHLKETTETKINALKNTLKEREIHYVALLEQQRKVSASTEKATLLYEKRNKELETLLLTQKNEINELKNKLSVSNSKHNSNEQDLYSSSGQGSSTISYQQPDNNSSNDS